MPDVSNPGGARPPFYDRNPIQKSIGTSFVQGEGGTDFNLETYTVPAGKKAMVTSMYASVMCNVAADTTVNAAEATCEWEITPDGGSTEKLLAANLHPANMAPGDRAEIAVGGDIMMLPGDQIVAVARFTGTSSGAGRTRVKCGASITEFDQ